MRAAAKRALYAGLRASGVNALFGLLNRSSVPILFYHGVIPERRRDLLNCEDNHLAAEDFEAQLRWLKANRVVTPLRDHVAALRERRPVDPRAVVITFDDGFENNYTTAFPLLKKHGLPAAIFAVSDFVAGGKALWVDRLACAYASSSRVGEDRKIAEFQNVKRELKKLPDPERQTRLASLIAELCDGREPELPAFLRPLRKEQLREMIASGLVEVGSHSRSHAILPNLSPDQKRREIFESKKALEEICGSPIESFAYPNGDFDEECKALAREAGYSCALACGLALSAPGEDPYAISRLALGPGDTGAVIAATFSGLRQRILALRS